MIWTFAKWKGMLFASAFSGQRLGSWFWFKVYLYFKNQKYFIYFGIYPVSKLLVLSLSSNNPNKNSIVDALFWHELLYGYLLIILSRCIVKIIFKQYHLFFLNCISTCVFCFNLHHYNLIPRHTFKISTCVKPYILLSLTWYLGHRIEPGLFTILFLTSRFHRTLMFASFSNISQMSNFMRGS